MKRFRLLSWLVLPATILTFSATAAAQSAPRTRAMDDLNWMEFAELVPARVKTVILTVGTLEPHGVVNNGADNTAPVAIAKGIAADAGINAPIAPHLPYGITGAMAPYPGAFAIPEEAYRPFIRAVLEGLAGNKFRDIIIINGHGGPQTAILNEVAREVSLARGVNTLVINWWSLTTDISREVFGSDGGHAGVNETAFIQPRIRASCDASATRARRWRPRTPPPAPGPPCRSPRASRCTTRARAGRRTSTP